MLRDPGRAATRDGGHNDFSLCSIKNESLLSGRSLRAMVGCTKKNRAEQKTVIVKRKKAKDSRIESNEGVPKHTKIEQVYFIHNISLVSILEKPN